MKTTALLLTLLLASPFAVTASQAAPAEPLVPNLTQLAEKAPTKAEALQLKRQAESKLRNALKRLENNKRFRAAVEAKDMRTVKQMLRKESGHTGGLALSFNGSGGVGIDSIVIQCRITFNPFSIKCSVTGLDSLF